MPTATVNGIDLNYELEGDGAQTVVLVNGLADSLETWVLQMDALLGAGYRVLRFDNRGIGASGKPAGPYTTALFADDAKALVDHLGITGFHLLGVSMGGMIAQEYALAHPGDLPLVRHIRREHLRAPACRTDLFRHFAQFAFIPRYQRDLRPRFRQRDRHRLSEPFAGAGDKCDFAK